MALVGSGGIWWDLVGSGGIWWNIVVGSFDSTRSRNLVESGGVCVDSTTFHLWQYVGGSLWNQRNCTEEGSIHPTDARDRERRQVASGPSTTEYDRGYSDTSDDEGRGQSNVMDSSEYSPVSDAEQEPRNLKTEGLLLAQYTQGLKRRRSTT
jgi:hypothetical protein